MTLRQDRFPMDSRSPDCQPDGDSTQRQPITAHIAGLALLAVLTPLHGLWAAQVVLVPFLLTFPGVLLLRVLRVPGKAVAAYPIYLPSAALVVLTASGLAVDLIGPLLHISEPLRAAPLLVGLEIVCAALLACSMNAPPQTRIPWSSLPQPLKLVWPLVFPLLSAAGALRLNSGHSGHLAAVAVVATIILLVIAFLMAPQFDRVLLAIVLFATGLGMMWSFSLRGSSVYGWDIAGEYYWLNQTVVTGVWHFSHSTDAYGAMLSVTVLPAELHALSGMPALLIFKVVYPVIFAMFPVAVYTLGDRVLRQRWAFMAGTLVIVQLAFFQEFPALAREEIATVLFAALISAVLDTALRTTDAVGACVSVERGSGCVPLFHGLPHDPVACNRGSAAVGDFLVQADSAPDRNHSSCLRCVPRDVIRVVWAAHPFHVEPAAICSSSGRPGHQPTAKSWREFAGDLPTRRVDPGTYACSVSTVHQPVLQGK